MNKHHTTRNIAKSGDTQIWQGINPFQIYYDLKRNHLQSASCHIASSLCGI
jgi:hypothetical protein